MLAFPHQYRRDIADFLFQVALAPRRAPRENARLAPWSRSVICGIFVLFSPQASVAQQLTTDACLQAHESAQELRVVANLLEAKQRLLKCSSSQCPAIIRKDCGAWYSELQAELPSLVVSVKNSSLDIVKARLYIDEEIATEKLDGLEIELNPGSHLLFVEVEGARSSIQKILLSKGQKSRLVTFQLAAPSTEKSSPAAPAAKQVPQENPSKEVEVLTRPIPVSTYVLGGGALLGAALGTGFAIAGNSAYRKGEETCSPYCSSQEKSQVDTYLLLADISFGLAILSAGAAIISYVWRPTLHHARQEPPLSLGVSSSAAQIHWRGTW